MRAPTSCFGDGEDGSIQNDDFILRDDGLLEVYVYRPGYYEHAEGGEGDDEY